MKTLHNENSIHTPIIYTRIMLGHCLKYHYVNWNNFFV